MTAIRIFLWIDGEATSSAPVKEVRIHHEGTKFDYSESRHETIADALAVAVVVDEDDAAKYASEIANGKVALIEIG